MAQYIDKAALVAEIERRLNHQVYLSVEREIREQLLSGLLLFINTLEVKEVNEEPVSEDLNEAKRRVYGGNERKVWV